MTKEARNPNVKSAPELAGPCSDFEVWNYFVIRHLSFVIPISSFGFQFHFNIIPFHHNLVTLHTLEGRWGEHVACFEVKFRLMPRANDLATVHFSFRQGSACMGTSVVDSVKSPADVEHRDA